MNIFKNLTLRMKLMLGFALPTILIGCLSAVVYTSVGSLIKSTDVVNHTHEAIELGDGLTGSMVNMETGLRGYLITGEDVFLQPYHHGDEEFEIDMADAMEHVSDNPLQLERLEKIESMKVEWMHEHADVAIEIRQEVEHGAEAAAVFAELSRRTVGKEIFDNFRVQIAQMDEATARSNDLVGKALVSALLMDMVNQETGQRGFLLSGDEPSLEPYTHGKDEFEIDAAELRAHFETNNYAQNVRTILDSAVTLAHDWASQSAQPEIDARREMNKVTKHVEDITAFIDQGIGKGYMDAIRGVLSEFIDVEKVLIDERMEGANSTADFAINVTLIGALIAILLGSGVAWLVTRSVSTQLGADPARLQEVVTAIANDDLEMDLQTAKPATGVFANMQTMQKDLRERTVADRAALAENGRVKQALDRVSGNVMIGDPDLNIIYMNEAVSKLFGEIESEVRKDLPGFNASNMMDTGIDQIHENPSHQRTLLINLNTTHTEELELGGCTLRLVANPVLGADGERLGTVVEWTNRTQELAIESEVQHVVDSALAGDLTNRITLDDKAGFFKRLSGGVNELVGVAEKVINDTVRVLSAMAAGNLTETIEEDYKGSFQQLKEDANATVAKLTEVVGNIQSGAGSVKTGADEISQGNTNLSQRTEEQASSLEETASSMEEMTSTVKQNADNAGEANQLAMAAREQAEKGGAVVRKAVEAMNEINASSKKISDIIGVIDEIAFQTNLLALNASVEAARAGDQGRGFAVVASEVRNLAGRSATAAKEIKELIEDSGSKVEEGSRLVNESGETLDEIVTGVKKVTDIVGEIAAASQEQSAGIDEVNKAIVQLDELTQQNAALVEEASAASQAMGEQADDLNGMISFFTVDQSNQVSAPATSESSSRGGERRSAERPWRGAKTTKKSEQAAAPKSRAAASGSDEEWEEF